LETSEFETENGIPKLLTLAEVATNLRLSPHTIRSMVRQGRLRPIRICRRLLFALEDVHQFVTQHISGKEGRPKDQEAPQ